MSNRRILFVDDEANVVDALKRQLRKAFEVHTSTNPCEAVKLLEVEPDFAVVVSDMRMPQMSGVEFLKQVKKLKPESVRIMLTGNSDQLTAAGAVNEGEVFKFLNKPFDGAALSNVLEQALRQYQLVTAERELLSRTLQGSIDVLLEALSIAKPEVFGSVDRIERRCSQLAQGLPGLESWELRAAARLSRLGCIAISSEILAKVNSGAELSNRERAAYEAHPDVGAKLIAEIPRLEHVANCILYQHKNFDGSGFPQDAVRGDAIPLGARILRVVTAHDELLGHGLSETQALSALQTRASQFDPALLTRFGASPAAPPSLFRVAADKLHPGLTIAEDVQSSKGILLVCRGQVVTPAVQRHLKQFFESGSLLNPILVTSSS